jgi:hypothetical protein
LNLPMQLQMMALKADTDRPPPLLTTRAYCVHNACSLSCCYSFLSTNLGRGSASSKAGPLQLLPTS